MSCLRKLRDERGFTIIESLVAAVVLVVGLAGVATVIVQANATTTSVKSREQGTALNRELIEAAHSIPYGNLTPGTVVSTVQGMPGLANAGAGAGWTIKRRGIVYTVAMGVCSIDDATDHIGAHAADTFCATGNGSTSAATCAQYIGVPANIAGTAAAVGVGAAAGDCGLDTNHDGRVDNLTTSTATGCPAGTSIAGGDCDAQPEDYKRVVVLVTWDRGGGSRYVLDSSTIPFSGLASAPTITSMSPSTITADSTGAYPVVPTTADDPSTAPSSLTFTATTDRTAQSLIWSLNGTDQATIGGPNTTFTFTWNLGPASKTETAPAANEVLDGTYLVSARALSSAQLHGATYTDAIVVNRRAPFPPQNFQAGFDNTSSYVIATWSPVPDGDIQGYRLLRMLPGQSTYTAVPGCGDTTPIAPPAPGDTTMGCNDMSPGHSVPISYEVVAVDKDPSGNLRNGIASTPVSVNLSNHPPTTPTNVQITVTQNAQNSNKKDIRLSWDPSTDPDTGDTITYFICIDGTAAHNCTTSRASSPYIDTGESSNQTHTYQVYAQDNHNATSALSTQVSG
jgi:Tfp pilus assembly protein PilV